MSRVQPCLYVVALFFLLSTPLHSQSGTLALGETSARYTIDWQSAILSVELQRPIARGVANQPAAPAATQAALKRDAMPLLVEAMLAVPWSSTHTVGEYVASDPSMIETLYEVAERATVSDARSTPDLRAAIVTFRIELHADLTRALVGPHTPRPIERVIGWEPTADYTGIIIYAADELPVFGTNRTEQIVPVVAPELYYRDESGSLARPIIETSQIPGSTLESRGFAAYATVDDSLEVLQRVGERPLRILSRALFGTYPADPILEYEDAMQLLSSAANRTLLQEGRVVVIVPADTIP